MLDKDILLLIHVIILWKIVLVIVIVQFERNFQFKLYNTRELIFRIFYNKFISSSNCLFIFTCACSVKLSLLIFLLIARLDNISFSSEKKEFRFMWKRISDK